MSYESFRSNYLSSECFKKFKTNSGIDKIEERLFQNFFNILSSKINIYRSNIAFKGYLYENFSYLDSNNEFSNSLIITRNEIIENIEEQFKLKENLFVNVRKELSNKIDEYTYKIKNIIDSGSDENVKIKSSFWNIFNLSGNFIPYNDLITKSRHQYYKFNKEVFEQLTDLSNKLCLITSCLTRFVSSKYLQLFIDLQNRQTKSLIERTMQGNSSSSNDVFDINSNKQVEELVRYKLDKFNTTAIHLLSIFAFSDFTLESSTSYYWLPAYGGIAGYIMSSVFASFGKKYLILSLGSGLTSTLLLFLASYLKNKFIDSSKENFKFNTDKLIKFLYTKNMKLFMFQQQFDRLCGLFEKDALELLDLISGLKNN
jgi:hypothetical protein